MDKLDKLYLFLRTEIGNDNAEIALSIIRRNWKEINNQGGIPKRLEEEFTSYQVNFQEVNELTQVII
tara:strand:+ start:1736 stop:1936 length:201 start_codon:yes stop_codon:yes gene_type:complete